MDLARMSYKPDIEGREISLGEGLPEVPERLLLAHARGEVLFVCGAGISVSAGLPDFRKLVVEVYGELDAAVHDVISGSPEAASSRCAASHGNLNPAQIAEIRRFDAGEYDVALGMLERRVDDADAGESGDGLVRQAVREALSERPAPAGNTRSPPKPAPIHRAIVRLAERGTGLLVVTTNFDRLLEEAARRLRRRPMTYALAGTPRPSTRPAFEGVFHLHGAMSKNPARVAELVLTDRDFGEYYLRRRVVPDFIYDAARLYHLVLVGYSANDPPMRYLLNAVAADTSRFTDIKERFSFVGAKVRDEVALADWRARGITPIHYDCADAHVKLLKLLERWGRLFPVSGKRGGIEREVKRIVRMAHVNAPDADRSLFDHFLRRSDPEGQADLVRVAGGVKADVGWLDAAARVMREFR